MAKAIKQSVAKVHAIQAMETRNAKAAEQVAFACQMMSKAAGDTVAAIKFGVDALVRITGYAEQQGALKQLGAAYVDHRNDTAFKTGAGEMKLESGVRFIKRRVAALHPDFKFAKSESVEAERKRQTRKPRVTGGKSLNTGTNQGSKKPGEVLAVQRSDWDSVLIQTDAKICELIEALVPVSGINDYRQALAAYNTSRTAFIGAVKAILNKPAPKAKRASSK